MSKVVRPSVFALILALVYAPLLWAAASGQTSVASAAPFAEHTPFSFALNIGGPAYQSLAGIEFAADSDYRSESEDLSKSKLGAMSSVEGTQEPTVYQTYRQGQLAYAIPVPAAQSYAVTLYITEPKYAQSKQRVFDVIIEDEVQVAELDIIAARDGKPRLALTRTIPAVEVLDGVMNIALKAVHGSPVLSGLYIRSVDSSTHCSVPTWQEDFNGEALNEQFWNYDLWPAGKVNQELQRYTRDPKNVRLHDGKLIIEAHHLADDQAQFSSARVHTAGKVDLQYGRIEVSAKLPTGKGVWPAIWMLPTDPFKHATTCGAGTDWQGSGKCDAWPNSGEIDIMEHVGFDPARVHATVHTEAFYWVKGNQRKGSVELPNANQGFHTYGMDWTPERLDFWVDNVRYFTYFKTSEDWQAWPFDAPFHLIINLAVGGGWGGAAGPPDLAAFPTQFVIDQVKVFDTSACPLMKRSDVKW